MPIFEIQGPDGKTYEADAPDLQSAASAFKGISWSDVPKMALENALPSAKRLGSNIMEAVTSPVQTAKNMGKVALGALENVAPYPEWAPDYAAAKPRLQQYEQQADAVGQFYKDRYGSAEGIKQTLATDPVGAAADAATVLTGGGAALARAPGMAGTIGNAAQRAGSLIDPISNAGRAVGAAANAGGRVASHALGMTTGAGSMPVRTAFEAGRTGNPVFQDHMRGMGTANSVVDMASDAMKSLRKDRSDAYTADIRTTKGSTAILDYKPIRKAVVDAFMDATYMGVAKDAEALKAIEQVGQAIQTFEKLPYQSGQIAEGLDALKQAIGAIREGTKPNTGARRAVDNVYHTIKKTIVDQVPEYAQAMKGYADASDVIDDLKSTFSLSERAGTDTTMRKLQSVTRNNVNTNYGERARLMDELAKKQPDLPYALAGQAMSSPTPRGLQSIMAGGAGLASITNPQMLAALPFFSPRIVGEGAQAAGRGVRRGNDALQAIGGPQALARALLAANAAGQTSGAGNRDTLARLLGQ